MKDLEFDEFEYKKVEKTGQKEKEVEIKKYGCLNEYNRITIELYRWLGLYRLFSEIKENETEKKIIFEKKFLL